MSGTKKKMLIASAVLTAAGLVVLFLVSASVGFDLRRLSTEAEAYFTNTYTVGESFSGISIEGAESEIRLVRSDDGSCRVDCAESDDITYSVTVRDGLLSVERREEREWYDFIGFFWGWGDAVPMEIVVYLPGSEYESLYVKSLSGDVEIPEGFTFGEAQVKNTSGSVSFTASVEGGLSVETVSGDLLVSGVSPASLSVKSTSGRVTVEAVRVRSEIAAKAVSGDILLSGVECQSLSAEATSGWIELHSALASEDMRVKSVSGDVVLRGCDADSLWIKTTSGCVRGTLLTEKTFITKTTSGYIDVPRSTGGGECEVTTTSGDIEIQIRK